MFEKLKAHFGEIIGWIVACSGVWATLIASDIATDTNLKYTFCTILATELALLVIVVWNLKIKYSYENQKKDLKRQIEDLNKEIEEYKEKNLLEKEDDKKRREEFQRNLASIMTNIKNASKLNNELCKRIPEMTEKAYHILEVLQSSEITDENILKTEIIQSYEELAIGLFDIYKRYSSHLLNHIVTMLEAYLRLHENKNRISATIKLFDQPLYFKKNTIDDIIVYTAFRDKKTYDENKREIGVEAYTINGNADFLRCLQKDQFIINNANKNDESYFNEHQDFDTYYNCALVVALRIKQVDNSYKFLGYLCCDCLNTDNNKEIFDKEMAQLLFSMAQLYATFLETLDSNWQDRKVDGEGIPQSILKIIFDKTYVGKSK